jgi:type 1 fimbria pilin
MCAGAHSPLAELGGTDEGIDRSRTQSAVIGARDTNNLSVLKSSGQGAVGGIGVELETANGAVVTQRRSADWPIVDRAGQI